MSAETRQGLLVTIYGLLFFIAIGEHLDSETIHSMMICSTISITGLCIIRAIKERS